ncbi:magnesium transporter CorA family protein [Lentilactobacillus raoultii]|uniref:Magnesium transporter CorA family protein n=1 Tax=Lentilactobacillus raoultii TaxID=1987503 RepID=A0ABW3PDX2_9LACO|nr:magnesium transporter CorA family protein [Lentilactobacillus raoultii]
MIKPEQRVAGIQWIETERLTVNERQLLQERYAIDEDIMTYVTDKDESANYVHDINEGDQLFIFLAPYPLDRKNLRYITRPFAILLHKGRLFTFNESRIREVNAAFRETVDNPEVQDVDTFILESLFALADSYIPISREASKRRNHLDKMLNRNTKNADLIALSHLQQTLTFLSSATQINLNLLNRLPRTYFGRDADQDKKDLFEDVQIEAEQVQRMLEIETQVVDRIDHTFNNIANNNLNDTMKFLTIWSLTMAVPTIITGFYGMNVALPLSKMEDAWVIVILISVTLIVWLLIMLKVHHKM